MSRKSDSGALSLSRRQLLKAAGLTLGAAAAGFSPFTSAQSPHRTLNILSWPGHADPFAVAEFEKLHNCTVVAREYVGGEAMLGLINQAPPGMFDVVMADAEYVDMLRMGGFIDKLNPDDYPIADFFPEFQHFEGHWDGDDLYSVMLRFGYIGMAYRTDVFSPEEVTSYAALWSDKAKGRLGMFDWYLPTMGCLSLRQGNRPPFDIGGAQFDLLKKSLNSLAPQVSGFYSMSNLFSMLSNGTAAIIPGIGDWVVNLLQKDGVPVAAVVPEEGGLQWTESLSIVSSSRNKDLAKAFIQYMTSPEGQIRTARLPAYVASIPNRKGWELLNERHPEDARMLGLTLDGPNVMDDYAKGKIFLRKLPVQQEIEQWNDVWTAFKSA